MRITFDYRSLLFLNLWAVFVRFSVADKRIILFLRSMYVRDKGNRVSSLGISFLTSRAFIFSISRIDVRGP
jgi:hypothetical protein